MENAKNTFISSTFWSDRIGFVAGYHTLKYMNYYKSWNYISKTGKYIKKEWKNMFSRNKYSVEINGLSSIPSFSFKKLNLERSTFITQEMLKKNFLFNNTLFISLAHSKNLVKKYLQNLEETIHQMQKIEEKGIKIKSKLLGPVKASTFKRLN